MMIADLHIHSKYSRATSGECVSEYLDLWARKKGIGLVGTGDFTHPAWRAELAGKLEREEDGLYRLRREFVLPGAGELAGAGPRFVVTGEISTIYKKDGKTRKVHSVIILPSLEAADELSRRLEAIGNIRSDGRPILGLDCRDLLEITLEACPEAVFIPAHIWTPHFSLFGAFSGFDRIEDCFGDLTGHVHALETGLSSDPPMNWRLSALDGYQLVSNSDAHSPAKLGREANLLEIPPEYAALKTALETGKGLEGTLEFFPEEGKYHFDGHRNCHQCLTPAEAAANGGKCPVCGKRLTIGVLHRVEELADRAEGYVPEGRKPFESLVPLPEVVAASTGGSAAGKKVGAVYEKLIRELGSEFHILREAPLEDIRHSAGPCVEEGIRRLRAGKVELSPGYDGEFGVVRLLDKAEREALNGQVSIFGAAERPQRAAKRESGAAAASAPERAEKREAEPGILEGLNTEQYAAATAEDRAVAVVAGPGTGKTKTLVARAAWLIREKGVKPSEITAVTFTNRAAEEMRARLERELGGRKAVRGMTIGTFHAICLGELEDARVAGPWETAELAGEVLREQGLRSAPGTLLGEVSRRKNGLPGETDIPEEVCGRYDERLHSAGLLDFDDLLLEGLRRARGEKRQSRHFRHLLVDEFQDGNPIQYELALAWNRGGESLFVIGDPDQSIYSFRGADADCFARLEEAFPGLRRVRLVKNYRSTPEILACALPVIEKNPGADRALEPVRESGAAVRLLRTETPLSEGIFVAREIARQVGGVDMRSAGENRGEGTRSFDQFAVLCRTRRQLEALERCLRRDGIPCVTAGREDFLNDRLVRGALAFFQSLVRPADGAAVEAALRLAFSCPPDLAAGAAAVWRGTGGGAEARRLAAAEGYPQVGSLLQWLELTERFAPRAGKEKPMVLLRDFARAVQWEGEALEALLNTAVFHREMAPFLENLTLGREGDVLRRGGGSYEAGYVTLMTLHAAKGLEFPVVFLCGVNRGLIPYESERRKADRAEERRLFYVGMTRARDELLILAGEDPSEFLADIPPARLELGEAHRRRERPAEQLSLF